MFCFSFFGKSKEDFFSVRAILGIIIQKYEDSSNIYAFFGNTVVQWDKAQVSGSTQSHQVSTLG